MGRGVWLGRVFTPYERVRFVGSYVTKALGLHVRNDQRTSISTRGDLAKIRLSLENGRTCIIILPL